MLYRRRIYGRYVEAASASLAPESVAGLAPRRPSLRRFIARHFPPQRDAAILELGCGHGALLQIAREEGYPRMQGVDASASQVSAARRLGIDGVRHGELLPAVKQERDASLDAIVAYDVIEHLTRDELIELIDETARVLKPGGRFIVHAPNAMSPFAGTILYGDVTHEQAFTPESLTQLFLSSGFKAVEFAEDPPTAHGLKSAVRAVLWKILRQLYRLALTIETGAGGQVFTVNPIAVATK